MEASIVEALISQAPGMAGIIIVVVLFLKAIEKRDQMTEKRDAMFIEQMNKIAERLTSVETKLTTHDQWEREALETIQKDVKPIRKRAR